MTTEQLFNELVGLMQHPRQISNAEQDWLCAAFLAALGRTAGRTWRMHPDVVQAMIAVLRSEPIDDVAYHIRMKETQIADLKMQIRALKRKSVNPKG